MLDIDTHRTPRRRPPSRVFAVEAEELLRNGQVENATELCKRGLVYFPENISGYAVLAQAYALLGQPERGFHVLEDGYRRTGAEGLNMLRQMMGGEGPHTFFGEHTQVVPDAEPQRIIDAASAHAEPEATETLSERDTPSQEVETPLPEVEENKTAPIDGDAPQEEQELPPSDEMPITDLAITGAEEPEQTEQTEAVAEREEATPNQGATDQVGTEIPEDSPEEVIEDAADGTEPVTSRPVESEEEESAPAETELIEPKPPHAEAPQPEPAEPEPVEENVEKGEGEEGRESQEVETPLSEVEAEETEPLESVGATPAEEALPEEHGVEELLSTADGPIPTTNSDHTEASEFELVEEAPHLTAPEPIKAETPAGATTPATDRIPTERRPPFSLQSIESGEEEPDSGGLHGWMKKPTTPEKKTQPGEKAFTAAQVGDRRTGRGGLSLHSGTKISRLSSSNLRLIPGLEFAPLRRDDELKMKIAPLVNEPPPDFSLTFNPIIPGLPISPAEETASQQTIPEEGEEQRLPVRENVEEKQVESEKREEEEQGKNEEAAIREEPSFITEKVIEAEGEKEEEQKEEQADTTPWGLLPIEEERAEENQERGEEIDVAEDVEEIEPVDLFPEIPQIHEPAGSLHEGEQPFPPTRMTPLEELARRLETARIPIVEEEEESYDSPAFEPSIVSDTFAAILVGQGAYAEAIKAYQMLARLKPERREEYDRKIAELRWKISSV